MSYKGSAAIGDEAAEVSVELTEGMDGTRTEWHGRALAMPRTLGFDALRRWSAAGTSTRLALPDGRTGRVLVADSGTPTRSGEFSFALLGDGEPPA